MKRIMSRVVSILLVLFLLSTMVMGCSNSTDKTVNNKETSSAASSSDASVEKVTKLEPVTLSLLVTSNPMIDPFTGGDPNKLPYNKIKCEELAVTLEPIFTTAKELDQKTQLLISTNDAPDLLSGIERVYPGGVQNAYEDGVIVKINDYMDQYAPNFKGILEQYPDFARYTKSDDGSIYAFGMFRDAEIRCFFGPMIRKDLLDKAGLPLPETVDEWHTALKAFKNMGIKTPFTTVNWFPGYSSFIMGAYDVGIEFYIGSDDQIHFGPIEQGYKQYLETWSSWISEGLVDSDYLMKSDFNAVRGMLASGESASSVAFLSFLNQNKNGREKNPEFTLVGTKNPVLEKGQKPLLGQTDPPFTVSTYVSAKCKNIDRAMMWLDYNYSEKGRMLSNFGIEGITYNMVDGYPTYTQTLKNSINATVPQEISPDMYLQVGLTPSYNDKRFFEQLGLSSDEQRNTLPLWMDFKNPTALPPLSLTTEEQQIYSKYAEIITYVNEMRDKFMLNGEPLSKYDAFIANVKKMGIDDVLKVQNDAYQRFKNR